LKTCTKDKKTGKDKELFYTEDGSETQPSSGSMDFENPFQAFHFDMTDLAPIL
jgi:hypothetical protein